MKVTKEQETKNNKENVRLNYVGARLRPCPNKGITLIALVITIIVMLILVAVTITMAINGGLFEHAGQAVGDTQNEIDKEQELASGQVAIDGQKYNSIDEYINNGDTLVGEMISFTIDGEEFTTQRGTTWEDFVTTCNLTFYSNYDNNYTNM